MGLRRVNMSYDDGRHEIVHLGLTNHTEPSDSAYIRKCIEFYEINKGGAVNQNLILERLNRIEAMLKNGVVTTPDQDFADADTDDIFDDALEQLA
jgi:hypothetical protein